MFMDNSNNGGQEYYTSTRKLPEYKGTKPLITILLFAVFYVLFVLVFFLAFGIMQIVSGASLPEVIGSMNANYESLDAYTAPGVILYLGNVVAILPALIVAMKVSKERPFSTIITSRSDGKWNGKLFRNGLILSLVLNGLVQVIMAAAEGGFSHIEIRFTLFGFILFLIFLPFQCIAEEAAFRGFVGQTVGGWCKLPIIAIILQGIGFTVLHGYNGIGQISVLLQGLMLGFVAWKTKGIEVTCALHIVNNWFSFVLAGIGATKIDSVVSIRDLVIEICMSIAFPVAVLLLDKKFHWFSLETSEGGQYTEKGL